MDRGRWNTRLLHQNCSVLLPTLFNSLETSRLVCHVETSPSHQELFPPFLCRFLSSTHLDEGLSELEIFFFYFLPCLNVPEAAEEHSSRQTRCFNHRQSIKKECVYLSVNNPAPCPDPQFLLDLQRSWCCESLLGCRSSPLSCPHSTPFFLLPSAAGEDFVRPALTQQHPLGANASELKAASPRHEERGNHSETGQREKM